MAKGLSKSRYTLFCQCPKTLWLRTYKPDEAMVDAGVEARFESGNEVGDLAMGLFGPFVEVTAKREDGSLDLAAMVEKTKEEMAKGTDVICEASFTFEKNFCAVDILRKTKSGWAIFEVKSSSFPEFDGQCLNSDYVRQGELDLQQLFVTIDMKELVENEYLKVPARISQALRLLASEEEPDLDLSEHCMKPYGDVYYLKMYAKRL